MAPFNFANIASTKSLFLFFVKLDLSFARLHREALRACLSRGRIKKAEDHYF